MLVLKLSDKPCFLCGAAEDTAEVKMKDKSFQGVLCKNHVFQVLKKQRKEMGTMLKLSQVGPKA